MKPPRCRRQLDELGYKLSEEENRRVTDRTDSALADKKKQVYDEDVTAIVEGQFSEVPQVWKLGYLSVMTGEIPTASVRLGNPSRNETDLRRWHAATDRSMPRRPARSTASRSPRQLVD